MQFVSATNTYARAWARCSSCSGTWSRTPDGNGDGIADPQNVYDASLAAARYLCAAG